MCILFAATHPEMTSALILVGCVPRRLWAPDYPWGATLEERERRVEQIHHIWGSSEAAGRDLEQRAPSVAHDPWVRDWWSTYLRMSASPSSAAALIRMNNKVDVRPVLPTLRIPTLIIHRAGDRRVHVDMGRYMASQIPGARYVELPGDDHLPFFGDQDAILGEVEQYLTGVSQAPEPRRALLTLLAVEVVGPLDTSATFDDRRWQTLLETYHLAAGRELARFRAEEIEVTGGRVLAACDGPVRAITCAHGILDALHSLGLEGRAGVHAGECEYTPKGIQGLAVHIAGRVMAFAAPGTVVISGIIRGLIAGSPLHIEDLGARLQGGIPGGQRLYRVSRGMEPPPDRARETDFLHQAVRLSPREREVVALVARGRTNREIGEELGIAESTAERHVVNVLNKLGQHSRTQIAAWAAAQGLTTGDVD
jgi:DNA-binding CsgD family transcriptional regulator/class 3 adenylate cyclase